MDYKIYSLSNSEKFATLLVNHFNENSSNQNYFEVLKVEKQKFADGEINVRFNESVRGETLVIVAQIEMPYENIFELLLTLDAARRCAAKEVILVIPYLPHSRQERRDDNRSPITARLVADLLQNSGADRIISMDIHTAAIEGFYSIPFDKLYPFDVFVQKIKSLNIENLALVSPDFGFIKKMEKYQDALQCEMSVINKHRIKANEVSKMELIGNVTGKNVIIIDDIIDTATTLCKAADLLVNEKGALSVQVFATHGVLSFKHEYDNAVLKLVANKSISKVYLANTITKEHNPKIEYLDISPIFYKALLKIKSE